LSEYLSQKYAGIITEDDTNRIFALLKACLRNNRSEAARRCGVTDKATYDWEKASYIKLANKRKVLHASLECNYRETLEYLVNRTKEDSADLLKSLLATLYANALESENTQTFSKEYDLFLRIMLTNIGLVKDSLAEEVFDMSDSLRQKAHQFNVEILPKSLKEYSASEIIDFMKIMAQIYIENPVQAEDIAKQELELPPNAVKPIIETFKNLCSTEKIQTTATDYPAKKANVFLDTSVILRQNTIATDNATLDKSYVPRFSHEISVNSIKQHERGKYYEITTSA
jgi:hypothetical protein